MFQIYTTKHGVKNDFYPVFGIIIFHSTMSVFLPSTPPSRARASKPTINVFEHQMWTVLSTGNRTVNASGQEDCTLFFNISQAEFAHGFTFPNMLSDDLRGHIAAAYFDRMSSKWKMSYTNDYSMCPRESSTSMCPRGLVDPASFPFPVYAHVLVQNAANSIRVILTHEAIAIQLDDPLTHSMPISINITSSVGLAELICSTSYSDIATTISHLKTRGMANAYDVTTMTPMFKFAIYTTLLCHTNRVSDIIEILRLFHFVLIPLFTVNSRLLYMRFSNELSMMETDDVPSAANTGQQ
jgi:hypothetical protein